MTYVQKIRPQGSVVLLLRSVGVAVCITVGLFHVCAELVLLVTTHVGIAHEVQRVVVNAHCRCNKVQFDLSERDGRLV